MKKHRICQFAENSVDKPRCIKQATCKWGEHWFCDEHGQRRETSPYFYRELYRVSLRDGSPEELRERINHTEALENHELLKLVTGEVIFHPETCRQKLFEYFTNEPHT